MKSFLDTPNSCIPLGWFDLRLSLFSASKLRLHKNDSCFTKLIPIPGRLTLPFRNLTNFKRHISYYEITACSIGKVLEHAFQKFQDCIGIQFWNASPRGRLSCLFMIRPWVRTPLIKF